MGTKDGTVSADTVRVVRLSSMVGEKRTKMLQVLARNDVEFVKMGNGEYVATIVPSSGRGKQASEQGPDSETIKLKQSPIGDCSTNKKESTIKEARTSPKPRSKPSTGVKQGGTQPNASGDRLSKSHKPRQPLQRPLSIPTTQSPIRTTVKSNMKMIASEHPTVTAALTGSSGENKMVTSLAKPIQWVVTQIDSIYAERKVWEQYVEEFQKALAQRDIEESRSNKNTNRQKDKSTQERSKGLFVRFILQYYQGKRGIPSLAETDLWTLVSNCVDLRERKGTSISQHVRDYVGVFEKLLEHDDPNIVTFVMHCRNVLKRYSHHSEDGATAQRERDGHASPKADIIPFIYPRECALAARDLFSFIGGGESGSGQADNSILSEAVLTSLCALTSGKLLSEPKLHIHLGLFLDAAFRVFSDDSTTFHTSPNTTSPIIQPKATKRRSVKGNGNSVDRRTGGRVVGKRITTEKTEESYEEDEYEYEYDEESYEYEEELEMSHKCDMSDGHVRRDSELFDDDVALRSNNEHQRQQGVGVRFPQFHGIKDSAETVYGREHNNLILNKNEKRVQISPTQPDKGRDIRQTKPNSQRQQNYQNQNFCVGEDMPVGTGRSGARPQNDRVVSGSMEGTFPVSIGRMSGEDKELEPLARSDVDVNGILASVHSLLVQSLSSLVSSYIQTLLDLRNGRIGSAGSAGRSQMMSKNHDSRLRKEQQKEPDEQLVESVVQAAVGMLIQRTLATSSTEGEYIFDEDSTVVGSQETLKKLSMRLSMSDGMSYISALRKRLMVIFDTYTRASRSVCPAGGVVSLYSLDVQCREELMSLASSFCVMLVGCPILREVIEPFVASFSTPFTQNWGSQSSSRSSSVSTCSPAFSTPHSGVTVSSHIPKTGIGRKGPAEGTGDSSVFRLTTRNKLSVGNKNNVQKPLKNIDSSWNEAGPSEASEKY